MNRQKIETEKRENGRKRTKRTGTEIERINNKEKTERKKEEKK
jgi:hypothetical protein